MPTRPTLAELEDHGEFARRHIGPDPDQLAGMLSTIGVEDLDALLDAAVPASIRAGEALALPPGRTEREILTALRELAARNEVATSLIGMGYYGTFTPPVIQRNLLENPAWYTAYTPYQPEISQGRLEALLNFQTMVTDLTGMDLANASMLDEATAAAEAMAMCRRLSKSPSETFVVHPDTHPQTIAVLRTRAEPVGIDLVIGDVADHVDTGCFGALLSSPTSSARSSRSRRSRSPSTRPAGWLWSPPTCSPSCCCRRPASRGPTSSWGRRSGSGCRWASAAPTPPSSPRATPTPARCPDGWSACPPTTTAAPLSAWPSRPASSTSAARRRPATSAPRRSSWPTSPACTRCGTDPTG